MSETKENPLNVTFCALVDKTRLAQKDIGKIVRRSRKTVNGWYNHREEAPAWAVAQVQGWIEEQRKKMAGAHYG